METYLNHYTCFLFSPQTLQINYSGDLTTRSEVDIVFVSAQFGTSPFLAKLRSAKSGAQVVDLVNQKDPRIRGGRCHLCQRRHLFCYWYEHLLIGFASQLNKRRRTS